MITKIVTAAAIYIMIWWVSLFAVLPLGGDRRDHAEGVPVQKGNDPGAPVRHNLGKKMRLNSLVAFVLWLVAMAFMYLIHLPLPEIR